MPVGTDLIRNIKFRFWLAIAALVLIVVGTGSVFNIQHRQQSTYAAAINDSGSRQNAPSPPEGGDRGGVRDAACLFSLEKFLLRSILIIDTSTT